jgi:hypothetical protein
MKIKITESCAGANFSYRRGQIVDLPKKVAQQFIADGLAEEIDSTKGIPDTQLDEVRKDVAAKLQDEFADKLEAERVAGAERLKRFSKLLTVKFELDGAKVDELLEAALKEQ